MKSTKLVLLLFLFVSMGAFAQQEEPTKPEATEFYEPVPPVVTPGKNGSAPSDAIVLFDGSNLDAWESTRGEGGAAPWTINKDGSMTVANRTGDIRTKQSFGDVQLQLSIHKDLQICFAEYQ